MEGKHIGMLAVLLLGGVAFGAEPGATNVMDAAAGRAATDVMKHPIARAGEL